MATTTDERRPLTGALVWRLSLKWRTAVDRALGPLEMTHAQYVFMASLARLRQLGEAPSQRALAEFSGLEPMYVSKLARTLEQAGLLTREANRADPRAVGLELTAHGQERLRLAFAKVSAVQDRLLAPLGDVGDPRRIEFRQSLDLLLCHADSIDLTEEESE